MRLQKRGQATSWPLFLLRDLLLQRPFILGIDHLAAISSHDFDLLAFYHFPYDPVFLASLGEEFL